MTFSTREELVAHAKRLEGLTFEQVHPHVDDEGLNHKGGFGYLVESIHFGVAPNSRPGPDIEELGVEIKTTPMKALKRGGLRSKERLVLGIIDYYALAEESFWTSSFFRKNEFILLVFYLHEKGLRKALLRTLVTGLLNLNEWDIDVIEQDWERIQRKVQRGQAHLLSEGDTMYLAACTKGANASSLRRQPYSGEMAMQRAFALKSSYVNVIYESFQSRRKKALSASIAAASGHRGGVENHLIAVSDKYQGLATDTIVDLLKDEFNKNSKSFLHALSVHMLTGTHAKHIDEFRKANIQLKTIRLKPDGTPKESMSFPAFKFKELVKETWEESAFFELLDSMKFCFAVFQCDEHNCAGNLIFKGFFLWNMPQQDIAQAKVEAWEVTKSIVQEGAIVRELKETRSGTIRRTNFPTQKQTIVAHVRPHARDARDTFPLPQSDALTGLSSYTKHSFWLNSHYLKSVIAELQAASEKLFS